MPVPKTSLAVSDVEFVCVEATRQPGATDQPCPGRTKRLTDIVRVQR